jgi:hypothetical protein
MDLNIVTLDSICSIPRARSVSPERRRQLRAEGRCVRCGSQDYWVKDCSLRPFSPGPGSKPKTGRVTIAAIDNPRPIIISAGGG